MLWLGPARDGKVDDDDGRVVWRRHQDDELAGCEESTSEGTFRGGSRTKTTTARNGEILHVYLPFPL